MKLLAVTVCLLGSLVAYGQRTIEVKIQDTIKLEVSTADLVLVLYGMYDDYDDYSFDASFEPDYGEEIYDQKQTRKLKRRIKRIDRKLKKAYRKMTLPGAEAEYVPTVEVPVENEVMAEPLDEGQSDFEYRKSQWFEWLTSTQIPMDTTNVRTGYSEEGTYTILLPGLNAEQIDLVYWKASQLVDNGLYPDKLTYASIDSKRDAVNIQMVKEAQQEAASLAKALNATAGAIIRVYNPEWEEISCARGWDEEETEYSSQPAGRCILMEKTFVFEIK